ncbi:MAG: GNAT family N-acetyltransferase [Oscillibacter sp.]|nr:GNAT family N-acetyltransferase [Oscillibacter sp.]
MKTIYIDHGTMEGAFGLIFRQEEEVEVLFTGTQMLTENNISMVSEFSRLCGVNFFLEAPEVPFYSVPYLEVFASDGQNGWFAKTQDTSGGPIYFVAPDRRAHLVAEDCLEWYRAMLSDPDWRRKRLPGNWSRLPEDPEGRKNLTEALNLDHVSQPKRKSKPYPLPELFTSRAEAEKKYPIMDIWNVLRSEKTPRFQVRSMMSPQDREGRAIVHYQSWQETYPGLMPESVLAGHTLEQCRKTANDRRFSNSTNTFVALDREDGDRVVGFGTLSYHARDFVSVPEAGEIVALYVLREYQGLGLGRMLMERCLAGLPRPRAALFVLDGNEKAIGFYEHMGFRLTGHALNYETAGGTLRELEMVLEQETT